MKAQALATILTRVLGLWFVCEALFRVFEILAWTWNFRSTQNGTEWVSYPPLANAADGPSDLYVHDTYYVIGHLSWYTAPVFKLLIGVVLFIAAKRVARVLCVGVEQP